MAVTRLMVGLAMTRCYSTAQTSLSKSISPPTAIMSASSATSPPSTMDLVGVEEIDFNAKGGAGHDQCERSVRYGSKSEVNLDLAESRRQRRGRWRGRFSPPSTAQQAEDYFSDLRKWQLGRRLLPGHPQR